MEISKSKVSTLASLSSKKMRLKHGLFIAEGAKCSLDMLGSYSAEYIVATNEWLANNRLPEEAGSTEVFMADKDTMKKISSLSTPPDVLVAFRLPKETEVNKLDSGKLYLLLDGIQDPGNLGTIIRTADWFGFKEVICSNSTVDVFNPKVVQATMGSLKRVKVYYTNLKELICKSEVDHVYGTLLEGKDIFTENLADRGVIIMGNEGNGLTDEIKALVTDPLLIPPVDPISHPESLNVSIATAITLARFRH